MTFVRQNNRGFTLIELLVVVAIAGIILTAVLKIFIQSQVLYNVQEEVAAMQQNVRAAKMFLERDVRMAGSSFINFFNLQGPDEQPILPLWFENNHGAAGTDRLTIIYQKPTATPCGVTPTPPATLLCSDLATLTLGANMPPSTPNAKISEDLTVSPYNDWDVSSCSCNDTVYPAPTSAGSSTPIIISSPDQNRASVLIATNVFGDQIANTSVSYTEIPAADKLYHFIGQDDSSVDLTNLQLNSFPVGSSIDFFSPEQMYKAVYYVKTVAGISSLYRDTGSGGEVIAEHIEDFQCAFTLADNTEIDNRNLTAAEIPEVRLVTISILSRTAHEQTQLYGEFDGQRPALGDRAAGAADNYRRRLLKTTIKIRNFGLN